MAEKINFTKAVCSAAIERAAGSRQVIHDAKLPGLILEMRPGGSATFYLYKRIQGRPTRLCLGRFPDVTIEQARTLVAKHLGQVAEGRNPQAEKLSARREHTLAGLWSHWLEHAKLHKRTWPEDERLYKKFLEPWRTRRLSAISRSEVQALHTSIGTKNGKYAANRLLSLLRAMFNRGEEIGWSGANPARSVKKFAEQSRDRFLQPDEIPTFFKSLAGETELFQDFFMVALLTGARRGNVTAMRWEDINLDAAAWRIPRTKNEDAQVVHLPEKAVEILRRREKIVDGSPWVFPARGATGHLMEPKTAWKRIVDRAGLSDLRIHDLRRTLGSWQAIAGSSLPVIGASLGHRSQQATAVYARLTNAPVVESVNGAATAILAAAEPQEGKPNVKAQKRHTRKQSKTPNSKDSSK